MRSQFRVELAIERLVVKECARNWLSPSWSRSLIVGPFILHREHPRHHGRQ